ncbi:MAG: OmpA family protein [Bacteroidetes bacterium]|nr:OmpA family protein [Bacteroidota bacterium]
MKLMPYIYKEKAGLNSASWQRGMISAIMLLFLFATPLSAKNYLKKGEKLYENLEYFQASIYFKKAYNEHPGVVPCMMAANCFRLLNNSKEAEYWYEKTLTYPGHEIITIKYYADALKKNGKYEEAKKHYILYGNVVPAEAEMANALASSCDKAMEWLKNPEPIEIESEHGLNSKQSDFCPVFYKDGIVFASDRVPEEKTGISGWTGNPYLSLYYIEKNNGQWQEANELEHENINTDFHNGPAVFSTDGDTIYFSRVNRLKKRVQIKANDPTSWFNFKNRYINHSELYYAVKTTEGWEKPKALPFNNPYEYSVGHPALSTDGKILYFASDMPGGFGGSDLYYSEMQEDGTWGQPVNLGPNINTFGMESFPVINQNGTLYFSSDGHTGLGGLDIFSSNGKLTDWEEANNLKPPYNSAQDDFGILFDTSGTAGYLSSGRDSENGEDNIFSFRPITIQKHVIAGKALKEASHEPISGLVIEIVHSHTKAIMIKEVFTDKDGKFFVELNKDDYFITGHKNGYNQQTAFLKESEFITDTLEVTLYFRQQENHVASSPETKEFQANTIYFNLDKFDIRNDASIELDKIALVMHDNEEIRVELSAHCDCRASDDYNMKLSHKRAKAAVDYLIAKGIDEIRISSMAYGKMQLINHCVTGVECSDKEHQQNRRVEIKLIFHQDAPAKYTEKEGGVLSHES